MEATDVKLARVETALGTLIEEVRLVRSSTEVVSSRITRLEEATKEAVPQVWKLRERVAKLERDTANIWLELERLRNDHEESKQSYEGSRQRRGNRWWDVAKMALSPAVAALVMWLLMRQWG